MSSFEQAALQKQYWDTYDGVEVNLYTFTLPGFSVSITNFGACVTAIRAPARDGSMSNVVLGYADLAGYLADDKTYIGCVVGRFANRIANATFSLDGEVFHLPANNGANTLHGGPGGFHRKVWHPTERPDGLELTLISPDGDMGFPGTLTATVRYTISGQSLRMEYIAITDKATVMNLAQHSYFNLAGEAAGHVLAHRLTLNAERYTPVDAGLIPTGAFASVEGTPFDFRRPTAIGDRLQLQDDQLLFAGGYDHNWVVAGEGMRLAAHVLDPASGRTLRVETTEPGIQFYSGNFLDGSFTGAGGKAYTKHSGFCLETQHFPDSPNQPAFPTTVLRPGETLRSTTVFEFGVET